MIREEAERERVLDTDGEHARFRRDRAIVMVLLALMIGGLLVYMITIITTAREWRTRSALEHHENTARLCAKLLDEECNNAIGILRSLAKPDLLGALSSRDQGTPARRDRYLRESFALLPDLMGTAVYDANGRRLARYPVSEAFPASVKDEPWFHHITNSKVPTVGDVIRLEDQGRPQVFTIAVPVETREKTGQYLLAFYRLGNSYRWLHDVHVSGGAVFLTDANGRVIATSSSHATSDVVTPDFPLRQAMEGQSGALLSPRSLSRGDNQTATAVIGYALARQPRLAVFVVQPAIAAFAPTDFLLNRIFWVTALLVILGPLAAWNLMNFYHREQLLARRLSERNERLRQIAQDKSELLANVSHDLKTPIASMQLSLSGIMEDGMAATAPLPLLECLQLMHQELGKLSGRVRNLLDMSRLEAIETIPSREPYDVTDIVAEALERIRVQLKNRPLHAVFPPEPLLVECDPGQIETVVLNLLENSIKYATPDSPLHLSGWIEGDNVVFCLRDEGPGVPKQHRERIFEKFYQAATSHSKGGSGLGLAICKTIVEAHGGTIRVEGATEYAPTAGHTGAVFLVTLPHARETA